MNLLFLHRPFPCPPSPQIRLEQEEDTFTSLTAGVFVLWERQRVCTAGGSLEVSLSRVHSVEDVGRARQDRRHKPRWTRGPALCQLCLCRDVTSGGLTGFGLVYS